VDGYFEVEPLPLPLPEPLPLLVPLLFCGAALLGAVLAFGVAEAGAGDADSFAPLCGEADALGWALSVAGLPESLPDEVDVAVGVGVGVAVELLPVSEPIVVLPEQLCPVSDEIGF
jgi:hypothetical protein